MKKIAILCDFDILKRPRPFTLSNILKEEYEVFAIARECSDIEGIKTFSFPAPKTSKERTQEENEAIIKYCRTKNFDKLIYTANRKIIPEILDSIDGLDLIIIEDIALLPFGIDYMQKNPKVKILIDLREYYPLEYQNDALWMESFGEFFKYLCAQYLPLVHCAITVSEGIAQKYKNDFGITCEVFYSLPSYYELLPTEVSYPIQIIYHGFLSPDRDSNNLLEIAQGLDKRFYLNVMGLSNQKGFLEKFSQNMQYIDKIGLLPPVAMRDIIPFCNRFDIGIITLPANSFNNTHAMPNKFFEYIQSRLCVFSTPLPEITTFINRYKFGKTSSQYNTRSIVDTLNSMDVKEVFDYKKIADKNAQALSIQTNRPKIKGIIKRILKV